MDKVSCLEKPSFKRYKENYATRDAPEKFWDLGETGPFPLDSNLLHFLFELLAKDEKAFLDSFFFCQILWLLFQLG